METPVLLITFNRPKHTRRVLSAIMAAKPKDLYVFRDGPREGNSQDVQRCAEVVAVIEELTETGNVNLHSFYSDVNLGCGPGPATGISWFFENVTQGIVFEDDCLPSLTLFRFYEDLLNQYKDDERISLITGTNALSRWRSYRRDYIFVKSGGMTMGCWASWRRAWKMFDFEIKSWGEQKNKDQFRSNVRKSSYTSWQKRLDQYYASPPRDAWDYQWAYARILNGTHSIVSTVNQMSNIGFGEDSTHTPNPDDRRGNMAVFDCHFPLRLHSFKIDGLFDWEMYQRFSRKTKKSLFLRCVLRIIDFGFRR